MKLWKRRSKTIKKRSEQYMIPARVNVEIDEQEIKQHINQRLDALIQESLIMVDTNTLAKQMSMSRRFLEEEILSDVRIKAIERRKSRKKFFFYDELLPVIKTIVSEW